MANKFAEFKFPKPPGCTSELYWDGRQFVSADGVWGDILCYSETQSNWSAELTELHEQEAGRNHPIDIASRASAIRSIRMFNQFPEPIVLDVGCSSGFLVEELVRELPGAAVMGADYIAQPLLRLAQRLPGIPILQFDLRQCPLPDNCVDVVTCLNVLEHIDDHAAATRHLFRILKPGGIAHLEVPAGPSLYGVYDELLMHHRRYRMSDLVNLVGQAGFEVLQKTHLGFFVFPAFALAKLANRGRRSSEELKKKVVASQIHRTSDSSLFRFIMRVEMALGRRVRFPFGIRCVLVARKPAEPLGRVSG